MDNEAVTACKGLIYLALYDIDSMDLKDVIEGLIINISQDKDSHITGDDIDDIIEYYQRAIHFFNSVLKIKVNLRFERNV